MERDRGRGREAGEVYGCPHSVTVIVLHDEVWITLKITALLYEGACISQRSVQRTSCGPLSPVYSTPLPHLSLAQACSFVGLWENIWKLCEGEGYSD